MLKIHTFYFHLLREPDYYQAPKNPSASSLIILERLLFLATFRPIYRVGLPKNKIFELFELVFSSPNKTWDDVISSVAKQRFSSHKFLYILKFLRYEADLFVSKNGNKLEGKISHGNRRSFWSSSKRSWWCWGGQVRPRQPWRSKPKWWSYSWALRRIGKRSIACQSYRFLQVGCRVCPGDRHGRLWFLR